MRHHKKSKGRARDASAEEMFERALRGDGDSDRRSFDAGSDRKTRQMCQQVRRALMLALAGECDDDILREVFVDAVAPLGNGSQLLVRVLVPSSVTAPLWDVAARLESRAAQLRASVARSICRKRVPGLSFVAVPQMWNAPEGGLP